MASALARGLGEPAVVADIDRDRAGALAEAIGGDGRPLERRARRAAPTSSSSATSPRSSTRSRPRSATSAKAVVSILGGVPVAEVEAAYPDKPVYRFMPNHAGRGAAQGVLLLRRRQPCRRRARGRDPGAVRPRRHGRADARRPIDAATAAHELRAGVHRPGGRGARGRRRATRPRPRGGRPAGGRDDRRAPASCCASAGDDPAELRRRVTSPGGSTERGLAALEEAGRARGVRRRRRRGGEPRDGDSRSRSAACDVADYV